MNFFKEFIYYMIGRVPAELHVDKLKGKKLLHISDTPASFFGELSRLISVLEPHYIVHTGDLVDNIKLELYPGSLWRYERDVNKLIHILEQSKAEQIYIALGNHDDGPTVEKLCKRSYIIKDAETVHIEGLQLAITHYPNRIIDMPADFNLFGHSLTLRSGFLNGCFYLNGISNIHLIELETKRYYAYPYPGDTDNHRMGRGKIGL